MVEHPAIGEILYFVRLSGHKYRPQDYKVDWGVVEYEYHDGIQIVMYEPRTDFTIDGIPCREYQFTDHRTKLPKGWTYNTELFKVEYAPWPEELSRTRRNDKTSLQAAIDKGFLIQRSQNIHWYPQSDITKDGWKVIKATTDPYKVDESKIFYRCLPACKLFETFEAAEQGRLATVAEITRQCDLSDHDFALVKITETINHWAWVHGIDKEGTYYKKLVGFFEDLDRLEDVDVRPSAGGIEWKYYDRKRWNTVTID